jgi:NADPH-dependent 2,4-dienoyl-CoA reductase/sulfur reductase-like enzyme
MPDHIVIIGAGVAGATAAQMLRAEGYDGRITLIGGEPNPPYDRTTLSKAVLMGEVDSPPLLIPPNWWEEAWIERREGCLVTDIDPISMMVTVEDGTKVSGDRFIIATGSRARKLAVPGSDAPEIRTLRTSDDAMSLRTIWKSGTSVVIVGGGLIGCEAATTARKLGCEVTILEASDEILVRVLVHTVGGWCRTQLEALGVKVVRSATLDRFVSDSRSISVQMKDSQRFTADSILICIGAVPADELARNAGIHCDHGIIVSAKGETTSAGIFAIGDVANWPLRGGGRRSLETYLNAQREAATVAMAILGKPETSPQIPISWTEIAGNRIQVIGDFDGPGDVIVRGELGLGPALIFRVNNEIVKAAIGVGAPRDFAMAVKLVENEVVIPRGKLSDPKANIRDLLRNHQPRALA